MKKYILTFLAFILIMAVFIIRSQSIKETRFINKLINKTYVLEYGTDFDLKLEVPTVFDFSKLEYEENKSYPSVGSYPIEATINHFNKQWKKEFELIIKDTTAPEIILDKELFILNEPFDIQDYLHVNELSPFEVSIDDSNVSYDKEGNYTIELMVEDIYGNRTQQSVEIKISNASPIPPENETSQATYRSGHVIVNKKHGLPANFANNEDPTAALKLRQLIHDMKSLNLEVDLSYAGFRTYDHQKRLYESYINTHGQAAADISSAKPGYSEHQTGLAFDLRAPSGSLLTREKETTWVKENAHKYGFIVRYPEGKTHITGYKHEPWHLRYMGQDAEEIYKSGKTVEEYFDIEG